MPRYRYSRRDFMVSSLAAAALGEAAPFAPSLATVDFRKLISRSDLVYDKPVPRSEEGIPIGNGRMGSLVWTTPSQLRFQINRADVYASNCASNSFFERHNDYCGGCAYLDIDLAGAAADAFPETGFAQRLSVYDGLLSIEGKGPRVRVFGWPAGDVMAIAVEGRREPVTARLRMLRFATKYFGGQLETHVRDHINIVQTRSHTAASQLHVSGGRIALTQEFREGSYCCKSAVAVAMAGPDAANARFLDETQAALTGRPTLILVSSAATFDPAEDVAAAAFRQLDLAQAKGAAALERETAEWWHDFWRRGYVHLAGGEDAALVEQNYHYFLYVMGSSSRGKFPPKFNGMLWNTGGDLRTWGGQHWFANLSCYYEALPATARWELLDPMFAMYSGMFDNCATAARQQWGTQGIYIPETTHFDGLEKLPEPVAEEMRDLYLLRKPWEQRSAAFLRFAENKHPHSSRWNWIQDGKWVEGRWVTTERGSGPYGAVNHIYGTTAKVAYLYWRRYEYTLDQDWLRSRAYPMIRGAVEFYRNHPNLKRGDDGRYHLHWANSNESVYGARDTDEDISAMRGITAAALRAAEILDVDGQMRATWREFLEHLPPLSTTGDPEALKPDNYSGPRVFVRGLKPAIKPGGLLPDGNSLPMWFFDLCNVESRDLATLETAQATFQAALRNGLNPRTPVGVLSKMPIAAADLGRADAVRVMIPNQIRALAPERATAYQNGGVLANRMTLREGPQALDAQRLGRAAEALHQALLQSNPPAPGEDPILHVFPAWPADWDAQYSLAARGAFLVSASRRAGVTEFVEIESLQGSRCRLRNPFGSAAQLYRDGRKAESPSGSLLEFATQKGERIVVVASGRTPSEFQRSIP